MPPKNPYNRETLIISFLFLLIVIGWTALTIYQTLNTSTIPKVLDDQVKPLKSSFDTEVLNALNLRKQISSEELAGLPPRRLSLTEEGETTLPNSTPSAAILASPTATGSAQN